MAEAKNHHNYTTEMTESLLAMYAELGNDGIEQIAKTLGKPIRSVRSKLVKEGVYVSSANTTKTKAEGPSKKELLRALEKEGFDTSGFEGATKVALTRLLGVLSN